MQFNLGYATDVGRRRQQNQDSYAVKPELGLFVVADGMGGHRGGETASAMAVDIIPDQIRLKQTEFRKQPARDKTPQTWIKEALTQAIEKASAEIFGRSAREIALQGMGTTTTAMLFVDTKSTPGKAGTLFIGHVGDSRCYAVKDGCIWQLTRDHSLVQEKLRAGLITREELKTDRMRNVITRSVGFEARIAVDIYEAEIAAGDIFLICSDGLSGLVEDWEIREIIQQELVQGRDAQKAVNRLVATANANGGDDNITAVVVEVKDH